VEGRRKEGWRWVSASVLRPSCYVGQASPILEPCRLQNASNAPLIHMPTLRATRPHAPRRMLHLSPAWSRQSSKWAADKPNISNRHNYAHTHTHHTHTHTAHTHTHNTHTHTPGGNPGKVWAQLTYVRVSYSRVTSNLST